ncbi:hypothetical protein CBR_g39401 [Chara braunii]|uniref:Uncharacterized protein n=1 Tax=Chara braunii TaxID=69332 RepID=A0A388LRH4_CHABU|nr:hypothetical protein CBR_g39401 [Chara braunii]|eukprot:GBG84938.1 hypothetical protein CBR_g39401 [Chara braunii]
MARLSGSRPGRHGPGGVTRALVVFACTVAMAILACLLHPASAAGRRHLLQGDEVLTSPLSICATLVDTRLVAECRGILMTTPSADFVPSAPGETCEAHARNVVITNNSMRLYYILDQFCFLNETRTRQALSYWSADLQGVDTGVVTAAQGTLLTHWWNSSAVNGPAETEPTVRHTWGIVTADMVPMVYAYGLELSRGESHLFVSAFTFDSPTVTSNISWVVMIDVADGSRVSIPVGAHLGYGVAFNPAKTQLYFSDASAPPRILVAEMTGIETLNTSNFRPMPLISFAAAAGVSRPIFSAHSFTANGSCLYFIDDNHDRVLALNLVSETVAIIATESPSALLVADEKASSFRGRFGEVATTSDGLNVFVSDFEGMLWQITLEQACGTPMSKSIVANYQGGGVWGLIVSRDDLYVYVGTADGHITRLGLNLPTPPPA